ncbi:MULTISPECIES: hypothetical protein [Prescottella]|jgi:hypothetical protein|nr:hypothetical protein [Prescottella equi]GBF16198.1 hypothetical protein Br6_03591 [Rhodococcus sp. Br-6]MDP8013199.1 hypothetical protein [Prescottella equi]BCN50600.1 hypothetical protein RE9416_39010 [Prescottella equi]BCN60547.1 hypothetical protein RE9427_39170 [Prescottella equi]BCN80317.1 hypothetical protein RE0346_39770 [Prescottella equi]
MTLGSLAPILEMGFVPKLVAGLLVQPLAISLDGTWTAPPIELG